MTEEVEKVLVARPNGNGGLVGEVAEPQLPAAAPMSPLMALISRAVEKGAGIELIEKLVALHRDQEANEARKAFDRAMAAARAELPLIARDKRVAFEAKDKGKAATDYRHETMGAVVDAVGPVLAKHGLSFRFDVDAAPGQVITVTCIITHALGHREAVKMSAPHDGTGNKNSIQQMGSSVTYLQRYTLKAALGVAVATDDDGKASEAPPDDPAITPAQHKELIALLDEKGGDFDGFCKFMRVETLSDLPQSRFEAAKAAIHKAAANRAKTQGKAA